MTRQVINIGANPNDGSGDPLRVAFEKINNNFAELYGFSGNNAAPPDGSVQFRATNSMTAIAYSNGTWVVFGQPDRYFVSTDGENWNNVTAPVSTKINDVVATPLGFLAVGANGTIITSDDNGSTWTTRTSGTTRNLHSVHYDPVTGRSLTVGQDGVVYTSQDMITWVAQASGVTATLYGVAYNGAGTGYVAVGNTGTVVISLDGAVWTTQNSETVAQLNSVVYDGASYIAVGNGGVITSSVNGIDWVVKTSGVTQDLASVTTGIVGSTYVTIAVGATGTAISSSDGAGTIWSPVTLGTTNTLTDITWTGANFYVCGLQGTILVATNLSSWTNVSVTGTFAGSSQFTYDDTTATLTVPNIVAGNIVTQIFTPNIIAANQVIAYDFASLPDAGNVKIFGGTNGQVLSTDGAGNLSWITAGGGGNTNYSNANVAAYLPTYTGNIGGNLNFVDSSNSILSGDTTGSYVKLKSGDVRLADDNGNVEISASGNIWNFDATGNITLPLNTSGIYYPNGAPYATGGTNYSNANVANYLPTYGGNILANNVTVSGNVVGNVNGLVNGIDIRYLVFDFAYLQPNTYNNPIQYLLAKTGDVEFGTFTAPTPLNIDFGTF